MSADFIADLADGQATREELLDAACRWDEAATLAYAGVIALARRRPPPYDQPIAGLDPRDLSSLLARYFPRLAPARRHEIARLARPLPPCGDEFADLVALLAEHATAPGREALWLACAVATGCMGSDHLWQDLGLPSRRDLGALLREHFTALFLKNHGDMKWKRFFYRELCRRADVLICRSPSCAACDDYAGCFGPEEPGIATGAAP